MPRLTVNLVVWNGAKYISYLFDSLRKQTWRDFNLNILDNASEDGSPEAIKKELDNFFAQSELTASKENLGFAGGHNLLFKKTAADYVLLLNQDMYLMPDCLEKLVAFMDGHPHAGSISPRLMKWNFSDINGDLARSFSGTIDSLGLAVSRSRRLTERRGGEIWNENNDAGQFGPSAEKVFGVSGALPMYRMPALHAVAYEDEYIFDSSHGSYKEDVDLSFRLAEAGYESYVVFSAVAYHDRAGAGPKGRSDLAAAANKQKQSVWVKYNSYKNHLMTLYKNEYWQNFILDFPWILWYETKKFAYFLLFDRHVLRGLKEIWKNRRELAKKRKWIKSKRTAGWRDIRSYWS